jgi:hypothetical protein
MLYAPRWFSGAGVARVYMAAYEKAVPRILFKTSPWSGDRLMFLGLVMLPGVSINSG